MDFELAVTLAIPGTFVALAAIERIFPARPLRRVSWWRLKGVFFFVLSSVVSTAAPMLWMDFVREHRLMNLEAAGLLGGAALAFVATQLFVYWWHRLMHRTPLLWRWLHQMHHSAERLDVFGGMYFHPLDVVGFSVVQSVVPYMILGVSGEAALLAGLVGLVYGLFQHTNVRTPTWLGYLVQRPESHSVHHARGVHAYNYADLPLWDLVFGTFKNPERFEAEAGFWDGASKRVGAMLAGRDVAEPSR
jgi:sterol desaturase/sphingolipid hydroxylase (fatty acid hydroxylase superfamily)